MDNKREKKKMLIIIKSIVRRILIYFRFYFSFHDHQFSYFRQFHFLNYSMFLLFSISPSSIFVSDRLIAVWQTTRETANCPEVISGGVTASPPETNVLKWELGTARGGNTSNGVESIFFSLRRKFEQNLQTFITRWRQVTTHKIIS